MDKLRRVPHGALLTFGLIAAGLALFSEPLIIKLTACAITVFVLIVQYLQSRAYFYDFTPSNWVERVDGRFGLVVPQSFHAKGKVPNMTVYEKTAFDRYKPVECDVEISSDGDVIVISSEAISGQIRIY